MGFDRFVGILTLLLSIGSIYFIYGIENKLDEIAASEKEVSMQELAAAIDDQLLKKASAKKEIERKEKLDSVANALDHTPKPKQEKSGSINIYGKSDARFRLIVFSDLECPYCKRYHETPISLIDSEIDKVNMEFMHLPLPMHNPKAKTEAITAECIALTAGNKEFWLYINHIFKETRSNGLGTGNSERVDIEASLADYQEVNKCIENNPEASLAVFNDTEVAKSLGISSTPTTIIVDNQTGKSSVVPGAVSKEQLIATIKRLMASQK
tara:strand:+ start:497 stop:1300 length:804 start_codon:yes stop_codon:yes gene_type:complete